MGLLIWNPSVSTVDYTQIKVICFCTCILKSIFLKLLRLFLNSTVDSSHCRLNVNVWCRDSNQCQQICFYHLSSYSYTSYKCVCVCVSVHVCVCMHDTSISISTGLKRRITCHSLKEAIASFKHTHRVSTVWCQTCMHWCCSTHHKGQYISAFARPLTNSWLQWGRQRERRRERGVWGAGKRLSLNMIPNLESVYFYYIYK